MSSPQHSVWKTRAQVVISSILGAFLIYCGQAASNNDGPLIIGGVDMGSLLDMGGADMVPPVSANTPTCNTSAESFPLLVKETVTLEASFRLATGSIVDTAGYDEIIVYDVAVDRADGSECDDDEYALELRFRPDSSSRFGKVGYSNVEGRLKVQGAQAQIWATSRCGAGTLTYMIAGVKR